MAKVELKKDEPIEIAIRKFRKEVEKEGILKILKDKQYYKKPSLEKKLAKEKAAKKLKRRLRREKMMSNYRSH